jgi:hypothetical protein
MNFDFLPFISYLVTMAFNKNLLSLLLLLLVVPLALAAVDSGPAAAPAAAGSGQQAPPMIAANETLLLPPSPNLNITVNSTTMGAAGVGVPPAAGSGQS